MPPLTVPKVKPGVLMNVLLAVKVIGPVIDADVAAVLNKEPPEEMLTNSSGTESDWRGLTSGLDR